MENNVMQHQNTFKNVIVTEIELKDGTKTQMITIFNHSQIGFDEVNIGIKTALEHSHNAKNMESVFSSFKDGLINPICFFDKTPIEDYRPELDPSLNPHLKNAV